MKILVIRFGGIGGVMHTTPVVRCIKKQLPEVELHFLVAVEYKAVLANNPYIDTVHTWYHGISVADELAAENFDEVVDLQNSDESRSIIKSLKTKSHGKEHSNTAPGNHGKPRKTIPCIFRSTGTCYLAATLRLYMRSA